MFIILPYGHDRYVHRRQWATIALIVINVLIFAWGNVRAHDAGERLEKEVKALDRTLDDYPEARVRPDRLRPLVEAFGPKARVLEAPPDYDENTDGTDDLDERVTAVAKALDAAPESHYGYHPATPHVAAAFTSQFIHADIWHLLGNMLFLWVAGTVIESFWNAPLFLFLYLLAGVGGVLAHHMASPESAVPLIGASGAIAGLMGAYLIGHPRSRIKLIYALFLGRILIGRTAVAAWVVLPAWILFQVAMGVWDHDAPVAYWAHVGGFAVGMLLTFLVRRTSWISLDADEYIASRRARGL